MQVGYPGKESAAKRTRPLVLIVEDDVQICQVLQKAMEEFGFDVITAGDGIQAYREFEHERPILIISDIYLPYTNGIVLMNKIKVRAPRLPMILITGYSHYRQLLQGSRFPPDGFLSKPFTVQELYASVAGVLGPDAMESLRAAPPGE